MKTTTMILPAESLPLDSYDIVDLIKLRARIDKMLPQTGDMNLSHELVLQFQVAKKLQLDAQDDDEIPLNQKAQLINSSAALLKQLAEYQTKIYSSERLKALEGALITLLKEADDEERDYFMAEYNKRLELIGDGYSVPEIEC